MRRLVNVNTCLRVATKGGESGCCVFVSHPFSTQVSNSNSTADAFFSTFALFSSAFDIILSPLSFHLIILPLFFLNSCSLSHSTKYTCDDVTFRFVLCVVNGQW